MTTATVHVPGTTPYPWPWDGDLTPAATVLLVVAQDGEPAAAPADVTGRTTALARVLRAAGGRVVAVSTRSPARTGRVADGAAPPWSALLDPQDVDHVVRAEGVDAFYGSDLELLLLGLGARRLLLAGTPVETCVHSTLRTANDRGLECLLLRDLCLPGDPVLEPASTSMVEMSGGIFGAVGTSEAVLASLVTPIPSGGRP